MKIVIHPPKETDPFVLDFPLVDGVIIYDDKGEELFIYDFKKERKLELKRMCDEFNKDLVTRDSPKTD